MPIGYDFSGDEDSVKRLIKNYSTSDVLKWINQEANDIFNNNQEIRGAKRVTYPVYRKHSRIPILEKAIIQSWSLIDLAYYSIVFSNDFRGKKIEQSNEFYVMTVAVDNYREREEKEWLDSLSGNNPEFFFYLWGFAGEQFKFQSLKAFDSLGRDLYIIFEVSKKCSKQYDFNRCVEEEVGVGWKDVVTSLLLAWLGYTRCNTMEQIIDMCGFASEKKRCVFEKVISYYTTSYHEVRNSPLKRQLLYAKPFVKTQRNEVIGLGPYLNLSVLEHSIFWILRNYFQKQETNKQEFTNYFGECFEQYFMELLQLYVDGNSFKKIPEKEKRRADWKIRLGKYNFLIEQKSSVMMLSVKQQNTDVKAYEQYVKKTVIEAIEQLNSTESDFNEGQYIKVILLYEDYIKAELLDAVFGLPECTVENDHLFWLMTIDEMERLLWLYKNNKTVFMRIIEEKVDREISFSKEGRSIELLLDNNGIMTNKHLCRPEIDCYRCAAKDGVKDFIYLN